MDDGKDAKLIAWLYFFGMLPLTLLFLFFEPLLPIFPYGDAARWGGLIFWASLFVWFLLVAINLLHRHWKAALISAIPPVCSFAPTFVLGAECARGNCL